MDLVRCGALANSVRSEFRTKREPGPFGGRASCLPALFELPTLNEGIDELENGTLVGGGEFFDALEAFTDAGLLCGDLLFERLDAEQFVGGDSQGLSEIDEEWAGWLGTLGLVVGDDAVGHADGVTQLLLGQSPSETDLLEPLTKPFEGAFFHAVAMPWQC